MSNPNTMAPQRPNFYQQPQSRAFSPPYPSPSPIAASPAVGFNQPPPAKRQRLSPNPQSPPYGSPSISAMQLPSASSPVNGLTNGTYSPPAPAGSMGPPSRPADKSTDIRTIEDSLAGTGVNIDDEERALTTFGSTSFQQGTPNTSFLSQSSFGTNNAASFERDGSIGRDGTSFGVGQTANGTVEFQDGHSAQLEIDKANYQAAGRRQYELTDPFLYGDVLERRLNARAYDNGIKSPKDGLYHARKDPNKPLQKMQVFSPDGTVRVIDQGQTILSTEGGIVLSNVMDLVSLACKHRITGLLGLAAGLGKERRENANGRIPAEWKDIATTTERAASPAAAQSLKRSHSQVDESANSSEPIPSNPTVNLFNGIVDSDRTREESRLRKRQKRTATMNGSEPPTEVSTPGAPGTLAAQADSAKRVTKKDQKVAEAKFTEAQQHKHANETARMATSNLLGSSFTFGGKKKNYSWMTGGNAPKSTPGPVPTAAKINSALSDIAPVAPTTSKPVVVVPRARQFGEWDEASEGHTAIQTRDILTVLEHDGRTWRALQQGYNKMEGRE